MGSKSHMEPQGFSADLNAYLNKVLADNGREDRSGRWLEEITGVARRYDYWSKIIKNTRAMTTNDIDVVANAFGISAFEWVKNTRDFAEGNEVPALIYDVVPHAEDYNISEDPGDEYPNAAETPRDPG